MTVTRTVPTCVIDGHELTDGDPVRVRPSAPYKRDGGPATFHGAIVDRAGTIQAVCVWRQAWRYLPASRIAVARERTARR